MDTVDPLRFIFASFFVLGLLGLLAVWLRYFGKKSFAQNFQKTGRLAVVETQYIDSKTKLLLVKCDEAEHLLLLGEGRTMVIEKLLKKDL